MDNNNYVEIPVTYIEESTFEFSLQLVDNARNNISSGNLTELTMTVYAPDIKGKPIIGGNDKTDIFNANQGTITAGGKLTVKMRSRDTIITIPNQINKYIALIEFTFNGGNDKGKIEVGYFVRPGYKVK